MFCFGMLLSLSVRSWCTRCCWDLEGPIQPCWSKSYSLLVQIATPLWKPPSVLRAQAGLARWLSVTVAYSLTERKRVSVRSTTLTLPL